MVAATAPVTYNSGTQTIALDPIADANIASNAAIATSKLAQPANAVVTMTAWSLFA